MRSLSLPWVLTAVLAAPLPAAAQDVDYEADVRFALEELDKQCGDLIRAKDIDWKKVSKQFQKEAKAVETDQQHLVLLVRLLARLEDGHCAVQPLEKGGDVKWPDEPERTGAGMFWCRSGKKILLKNTWNTAEDVGLKPGMEVLTVDGVGVDKWLDARIAELRDTQSYSTDQHAFFHATHWGLAMPIGTRMKLEVKGLDGKKSKRTLTYTKSSVVAFGPAFFPEGMEGGENVRWARLPSGNGYVHIRRCKGDLPELMEEALAKLGPVSGIVLDFRGNPGGSFDDEALMGRFVPAGKQLAFSKTYASVGANPYGGPVVVIVDGTVRSAAETGSGMFKEDGRGYMIGESPTAGMSSSKTTIELPSRLFALYVSVASNKGRFNDGKGIEGIGVIPHEIVAFEAEDLAEGIDTLVARADELLAERTWKGVPYDPAKFGWEAPD